VSDALLLHRYAQNVSGDAAFVAGTGAANNTASSFRTNIQSLTARLDVDGDGQITTYDSQIAARIRLGFTPAAAAAGLSPATSGTRNTVALVTAFLNAGCPAPASGTLRFTPLMVLDRDSADPDLRNLMASTNIESTEQARFGSKSWKTTIQQGETGFGFWGGGRMFPQALTKAQSVHIQFSVFLPSDFDWLSPGEGGRLKLFRIHTETSQGENLGYNDLYIETLGLGEPQADGRLAHIYEGYSEWTGTQQVMTKGAWNTFEMRVDFDNVSLASGGTGRTRIWRAINGQLQLFVDVTTQPTLVNSTDRSDFFYIFTFWNGGAPKTQSAYIDRIVIETDMSKLVETDSQGNKVIGGL
jgi:hypothetical protein